MSLIGGELEDAAEVEEDIGVLEGASATGEEDAEDPIDADPGRLTVMSLIGAGSWKREAKEIAEPPKTDIGGLIEAPVSPKAWLCSRKTDR